MSSENPTPGTKLEMLSIELRRQNKYYHNSFRSSILFTLVLLVFFALYTALILYKIRIVATPSTIALLIAGELRDEASTTRSPLLSEDHRLLARETAYALTSALPMLSGPVATEKFHTFFQEKNLVGSEKAASKLFSDQLYMQTLRKFLQEPAKGTLTEKEKHTYVSNILKSIEKDFHGSIHPLYRFTPGNAAEKLERIRKKDSRLLTEEESAYRNFILCSLYFGQNKRYRDSRFSLLFDLASPIARELGFSAEKDLVQDQKSTKNTPVRKLPPARK